MALRPVKQRSGRRSQVGGPARDFVLGSQSAVGHGRNRSFGGGHQVDIAQVEARAVKLLPSSHILPKAQVAITSSPCILDSGVRWVWTWAGSLYRGLARISTSPVTLTAMPDEEQTERRPDDSNEDTVARRIRRPDHLAYRCTLSAALGALSVAAGALVGVVYLGRATAVTSRKRS